MADIYDKKIIQLTMCPTGCTQRRTINNRLAQRKTFDGRKCANCGFEIKSDRMLPVFHKFNLNKPDG